LSQNLVMMLFLGFNMFMFYKFMNIIYEEKTTNRWQEALSYLIGYVFWVFILNVIEAGGLVLILSIMCIFSLTFNYKIKFKKRIIIAISAFLLMCSLVLVANVIISYLVYIGIRFSSADSLIGQISLHIVAVCIFLSIVTYKKISVHTKVPNSYWNKLFATPIAMVLILFSTLFIELQGGLIAYSFLFLSIMNAIVFGLFDSFLKSLFDNIQTSQIEVQNQYYSEQLKIMEMSLKSTKIFEHDIANHISCLFEMISNENYAQAKSYLASMQENTTSNKHYIMSGVSSVDSVINFKISQAKELGIVIKPYVTIPENLNISSFDIVAILGNLLDNAINGAKSGKWIDLNLEYVRGRLMVDVKNSFNGEITQKDGVIITSNTDSENHGFGFQSIIKHIEKYDGTMVVKTDGNIFHTKILMYISENS